MLSEPGYLRSAQEALQRVTFKSGYIVDTEDLQGMKTVENYISKTLYRLYVKKSFRTYK